MAEPLKQFGPMYGERSRRHQFVSTGLRGDTIVSIYEVRRDADPDDTLRLNVELMGTGDRNLDIVSADLTVQEVVWLKDACDEFLRGVAGV